MAQVAGLRFADRYHELINDKSELIEQLRKEKEEAQADYHKTLNKLEETDRALEHLKKTIERYERENKALRELVTLWV